MFREMTVFSYGLHTVSGGSNAEPGGASYSSPQSPALCSSLGFCPKNLICLTSAPPLWDTAWPKNHLHHNELDAWPPVQVSMVLKIEDHVYGGFRHLVPINLSILKNRAKPFPTSPLYLLHMTGTCLKQPHHPTSLTLPSHGCEMHKEAQTMHSPPSWKIGQRYQFQRLTFFFLGDF